MQVPQGGQDAVASGQKLLTRDLDERRLTTCQQLQDVEVFLLPDHDLEARGGLISVVSTS